MGSILRILPDYWHIQINRILMHGPVNYFISNILRDSVKLPEDNL